MSLESALDSALGFEPRPTAQAKAARRDKTLAQALDAALAAPRPEPPPAPSVTQRILPHLAEFVRPLRAAGQAGGEELIAGTKELQPFGRGTEAPEQIGARVLRGLARLGSSIPAALAAGLASPVAGTVAGEYRSVVGPGGRALPSAADVLRAVGQGAGMVATGLPGLGGPKARPPLYEPGRWPGEQFALPPGTPPRALPPSTVLPRPVGPPGRYAIWTPEEAAKRLPVGRVAQPERLALPPGRPSPPKSAEVAVPLTGKPTITEIHASAPPAEVPVNPAEWTAMAPIQRKAAVEFFRQTLADETGRLDLGAMGKALHRFRGRFPMETAVIVERPNSPVISEIERWNTHNTDWISTIAKAPWWQGTRKVNPELLKDAEAAAVAEWKANAGTAEAAIAARHYFPPEIQAAMRNREGQFVHEQAARAYFGLEPIPETPGPYLPRRTIGESREAVSLGGAGFGTGRNRALQTTVKGHGQERVFDTYRQGEQAGIEYEDPRNSILYREWEGIKLRSTARLFRNLEAKGALFRDRAQALAASPTGRPWAVENAPGGGTWWTPTEAEAKFLQQNLTESARGPFGTFVGYANGLLRNPNLVNPAPHVVKNMAMKALLARGPVAPYTLARDAVEWARGANLHLLREFNEAMPFAQSGKTAGHVLGEELRSGGVDQAIRQAFRTIGMVNRPSQRVIFEWADPAMRYSLFKYYRNKGFGVYEAGNHAWVDLIRYGTRADRIDFWKSIPFNFFVPWRFGTMVSLLKQVKNHPVRTALLLGAVDYLREARYRATGRWTHLPQDYTEKPIVQMLESGNPKDVASVIGTTAIFGPGGDFSAKQLTEAFRAVQGGPNSFEVDRLKNAFWGISQLYGPGGAADEFHKGNYGDMLAGLLLGEHRALTYQPRRLMRALPESLPLMQKSPLVRQAEAMQEAKRLRTERAREHRKPRSTIEDKLRAAGYLK